MNPSVSLFPKALSRWFLTSTLAFLLCGVGAPLSRAAIESTPAATPPVSMSSNPARERILFNADWRFNQGDPNWMESQLDYPVSKPWMLASAAPFFRVTEARPAKPEGNFGSDVKYVPADFDDSSWRKLD